MPRIKLLIGAKQDLRGVLRYVARESGSVAIAQQFVSALRQKCVHLAGLPGHIGRLRPDLRTDARSFAYRGYVIVFRYVDDRFEVINVMEGHRDIVGHYELSDE